MDHHPIILSLIHLVLMCVQVGVAKGSLLPSLCAEVSGRLGAAGVSVGDSVQRAGADSAGRDALQR